MKFTEFENMKKDIEIWNNKEKEQLIQIVENIQITTENFDRWVEVIFSDEVLTLDLNKLPYIIDELYKTNDKLKFMLCCMLIESTCNDIPFMTNLENYPLFVEKYKSLKDTIIRVYESCNNGIADCMSLIVLNNDPNFEMMSQEEIKRIEDASCRKLKLILKYLKENTNLKEDDDVYISLEIILDLCCGLNSKEIEYLIREISECKLYGACKIYLAKYYAKNNLEIKQEYINEILCDVGNVEKLYKILEDMGRIDILSNANITQEMIAKSNMINWLKYPTELGKKPDIIECIGKVDLGNDECYIYKFKSNNFRVHDYMIGVAGAYPKNKITAHVGGYTFSKFELLEEEYTKQAESIINMISDYWKR